MAKLQITIDDGPQPVKSALMPILTELASRGVVAAFFNLGQEVKADPGAVRGINNAGHVLGNHSWDHLEPHTWNYDDAAILDQFRKTHDAVKDATGVDMKFWRSPRLEEPKRLAGIFSAAGLYTMSHCDIGADSKDTQNATTAKEMADSILADIAKNPGKQFYRLLFHVKDNTADALPAVLSELVKKGHELVDFSQTE